ncbi:4,5-DOPA dioxygenase extradiol [Undibacterium curvum]|uniref:4,5-DOPA-extradiol-dioxygenase n=1 Tax=Undibacterium curvum TaxID=2762294 RepID=UPI003D0B1CF4
MSVPSRMPVMFIGHGSPMNALEHNRFTASWQALGQRFPAPRAILMISAHWMTQGLALTAMAEPRTIHDFGGFPAELFAARYPAPGDPLLAQQIAEQLAPFVAPAAVTLDQNWGLDHGAWSVLLPMYPAAHIPVLQLSLDMRQPAAWHFALGKQLAALRDQGVLLMGSGNVVHNLRRLVMQDAGYDWAQQFENTVEQAILRRDWDALIHYEQHGNPALWSIPTSEHYLPLLSILGAVADDDALEIINQGVTMGAISMLSLIAVTAAAD